MEDREIPEQTVGDLRRAIKDAKAVYVSPVFRSGEREVRISKADAMWLVHGLPNEMRASELEVAELYSWRGNDLVL